MNPLIKWPGGKTREIQYIEHLIPPHERYIEPFFGGGAMYFHLHPNKALINDISPNLMTFYTLIKAQNQKLQNYLWAYCSLLENLLHCCDSLYPAILDLYTALKAETSPAQQVPQKLISLLDDIEGLFCADGAEKIILSPQRLKKHLQIMVADKMHRTIKNEKERPFSPTDLKENLITGFVSGLYMYFREVYNDILLGRSSPPDDAFRTANFYFIREYCYGSMFRYNRKGEFNIPYGGMSYNRKDFRGKLSLIFSPETARQLTGTDIFCQDFAAFIQGADLTEKDFMFLDPPYDTDFSDYEGRAFSQEDQRRLVSVLRETRAKFILIIKNTDFIYSLYEKDFSILCFNKTYTYNVRSRNDRQAEHLIITNLPL